MNKVAIFEKELKYIKNESYRNDTMYLIDCLPDYFFEVAAASTGKYHPKYAQGEGGLVRHTKSAVRIAYELLEDPAIGNKYTEDEKDFSRETQKQGFEQFYSDSLNILISSS